MKKSLFSILALLLVASMLLAACGGAEEPTTPPETAVEEPTEEPEVAEPEPTEEPEPEPTEAPAEEPTEEPAKEPDATIRIWADDTRSAIFSELADDFLAAYNVEVIVEEVSGINEQFPIAAPAGEGPDITIVPHDQAGSMVASGLLAPMDLGDKADMFGPSTLAAATYDGVLYGMPYATENLAFFYNTDLVPEPPTTWDEVLEIGQALIEDGSVTFGIRRQRHHLRLVPAHDRLWRLYLWPGRGRQLEPRRSGCGQPRHDRRRRVAPDCGRRWLYQRQHRLGQRSRSL